jgi:hypothetical protein
MRIDNHPRFPKDMAPQNVGRLTPDAAKRNEILNPPRDLSAKALHDRACGRLKRAGLLPEETRSQNQPLDVFGGRFSHRAHVRQFGEQSWSYAIDPLIGALRR